MEKVVGLKSKRCTPCKGSNVPKLSQAEAEALRIQVNCRRCMLAADAPCSLAIAPTLIKCSAYGTR